MTNQEEEQRTLDAATRDEHKGLALQVVGWTILLFCGLPAAFLFVGWRSGSLLWFWVTLGLGGVGLCLVVAGAFLRGRAAREFAVVSGAMRSRSIASTKNEEFPPPEDIDHRAA